MPKILVHTEVMGPEFSELSCTSWISSTAARK